MAQVDTSLSDEEIVAKAAVGALEAGHVVAVVVATSSQRCMERSGDQMGIPWFYRGWKLSHFGYIGHHLIVAIIDHIPNGWVMFNGDI